MIDEISRIEAQTTRILEKMWRRRDRLRKLSVSQLSTIVNSIFDPTTSTIYPTSLPALSSHDHTSTAGDGGILTNDQHDGYSQYAEIGSAPSTPSADTLRVYARDKSGVSTLYYITDDGTIYELPTFVTGGIGSGAPSDAAYVVTVANAALPSATVLSAAIAKGPEAFRPSAGVPGRLYYSTDTTNGHRLYRDTGVIWETLPLQWTDMIAEKPTLDVIDNPVADLDMDGFKITDLADPDADQDAATKAYVLAQIALAAFDPATIDLTQLHEHVTNEDHTAQTNGAATLFLTAQEFEAESSAVYLAGARLRLGTDYSEAATYDAVTLGSAPSAGTALVIDYISA